MDPLLESEKGPTESEPNLVTPELVIKTEPAKESSPEPEPNRFLVARGFAVKGAPDSFVPGQGIVDMVNAIQLTTRIDIPTIFANVGTFKNYEPCPVCVYRFVGRTPETLPSVCAHCAKKRKELFWSNVRQARTEYFKTAEGKAFVTKFVKVDDFQIVTEVEPEEEPKQKHWWNLWR